MTHLDTLNNWMDKQSVSNAELAKRVQLHPSRISRLRRGESGVKPSAARQLERETGIPWYAFVEAPR